MAEGVFMCVYSQFSFLLRTKTFFKAGPISRKQNYSNIDILENNSLQSAVPNKEATGHMFCDKPACFGNGGHQRWFGTLRTLRVRSHQNTKG